MLLVALNGAFAFIFLSFAWNTWKRGVVFWRTGWEAIRTESQRENFRRNVESRRVISEATPFLVGGLFWIGAAIVAAGFGFFFGIQLVMLYL